MDGAPLFNDQNKECGSVVLANVNQGITTVLAVVRFQDVESGAIHLVSSDGPVLNLSPISEYLKEKA